MDDTLKGFIEAARPLMSWLGENGHPHCEARVTSEGAEFFEARCGTGKSASCADLDMHDHLRTACPAEGGNNDYAR